MPCIQSRPCLHIPRYDWAPCSYFTTSHLGRIFQILPACTYRIEISNFHPWILYQDVSCILQVALQGPNTERSFFLSLWRLSLLYFKGNPTEISEFSVAAVRNSITLSNVGFIFKSSIKLGTSCRKISRNSDGIFISRFRLSSSSRSYCFTFSWAENWHITLRDKILQQCPEGSRHVKKCAVLYPAPAWKNWRHSVLFALQI